MTIVTNTKPRVQSALDSSIHPSSSVVGLAFHPNNDAPAVVWDGHQYQQLGQPQTAAIAGATFDAASPTLTYLANGGFHLAPFLTPIIDGLSVGEAKMYSASVSIGANSLTGGVVFELFQDDVNHTGHVVLSTVSAASGAQNLTLEFADIGPVAQTGGVGIRVLTAAGAGTMQVSAVLRYGHPPATPMVGVIVTSAQPRTVLGVNKNFIPPTAIGQIFFPITADSCPVTWTGTEWVPLGPSFTMTFQATFDTATPLIKYLGYGFKDSSTLRYVVPVAVVATKIVGVVKFSVASNITLTFVRSSGLPPITVKTLVISGSGTVDVGDTLNFTLAKGEQLDCVATSSGGGTVDVALSLQFTTP